MQQGFVPGQIVGGDFRVGQVLGEGGMGTVYRAEQISTGATRALKVMQSGMLTQPGLKERFVQEARVSARIQSDHIVQVVSAGIDVQTQTPWIAMELLEGMELAMAIETRGPLQPAEVREIFSQLGHAISAAHAAGVVHRDLKPENIFLARSRSRGQSFTVKVLDFGIAKILDLARSRATGAMGSALWMAPEQTQASDRVSPATDIWPLGLMAFYALTRRYYWWSAASDGSTAAILRDILIEPLTPPSVRAGQLGLRAPLPAGFDVWFSKCVNRDPNARFQSVEECIAVLTDVLSGKGIRDESLASTEPAQPIGPGATVFGTAPASGTVPGPGQTVFGPSSPRPFSTQPATPHPSGPHAAVPYPTHPATHPDLSPPATDRSGPLPQALGGSSTAMGASRTAPTGRAKKSSKGPLGIILAIAGIAALVAVVLVLVNRKGTGGSKKKKAVASANAARKDSCDAAFRAAEKPGADALAACEAACDSDPSPYCRYTADLLSRSGKRDDAKAAPLYDKGCQAGDDYACERFVLAELRNGKAVKDLLDKAQSQCDAGNAAACARAGDLAQRGGDAPSLSKAVPLFAKACAAGDTLGCAWHGMALELGAGVPRNAAEAANALKKAAAGLEAACTESSGLSCVALGWMREHGHGGVKKDPPSAIGLYERACASGIVEGCTNLGALKAIPSGGPPDFARAEETLKAACDAKDLVACNDLGMMRTGLGVVVRTAPRGESMFKLACSSVLSVGCAGWGTRVPMPAGARHPEARGLLEPACEGGVTTACVNLGALVRSGLGGPVDAARAADLFARACTAGNAGGCGERGTMLWYGFGIPRDRTEARRLWQVACDGGERDSCMTIADVDIAFGSGAVVSAGVSTATTACDERVGFGCSTLASAYSNGKGVTKDEGKSAELQLRACDATKVDTISESSCVNYAYRFYEGRGVAKDPVRGTQLISGYCDAGNKDACRVFAESLVYGNGIAKDGARGLATLDTLCKESLMSACTSASVIFRQGTAGPKDDRRAFELAGRACSLGDPSGCGLLGDHYAKGLGGAPVDKAKAKSHYDDACQNNIEWACQRAKTL